MAVVHQSRGAGLVYGLGRVPTLAGLDPIATQALAIYNALPAGSGVNPIGTAAYPDPHDPPFDTVVDTQYGGFRNEPWYWVHPVRDPSGLIQWTGADSAEILDGLDNAHVLAANILLNNGSTAGFADFDPTNVNQVGLDPTAGVSSGSQTSYIPTAPVGLPPGWTTTSTNPVAPQALTGPQGQTYAPTPQAPAGGVPVPGSQQPATLPTIALPPSNSMSAAAASAASAGAGGSMIPDGALDVTPFDNGAGSTAASVNTGPSLKDVPGGLLGIAAVLIGVVAFAKRK